MSGLARKTDPFLAPSHHADNSGHLEHWTHKQCTNQLSQWKKAHKSPTAKQTNQENKLLKKHDCNERV